MKKIKTEMSARSQELKNKFKSRAKSTQKNIKFDKIYEDKKYSEILDDLWKFMGDFVTNNREDFIDMYEIQQELISSDKKYIETIRNIKKDTLHWSIIDEYLRDNLPELGFVKVRLGFVNDTNIYYEVDLTEEEYDEVFINSEDFYFHHDDEKEQLINRLQTVFANASEFSKFVETVKNELPSKLDMYTTQIEKIVNDDFEDDRYPNEPDEDDEANANESIKRLNITKKYFNESNYFKAKYGTLKYVSESGNLYKTSKGKVLKFKESKGLVNESDYDSLIKDQWWDLDVLYIKKPGKTSVMYKDSDGDDICFKWSEVKSILADFQHERGESGDIDEWIAKSGIIADHGIEILDDLVTEVEENPEMRPVFCYGGPEI